MSCPNCGVRGTGGSLCATCNAVPMARESNRKYRESLKPPKGRGPSQCFTSDTLVATPSGYKYINEIEAGTFVIGLNGHGEVDAVKVRRADVHKKSHATVYAVHGIDDQILFRGTGRHPVLTSRGWKRIKRILPGDAIQTNGPLNQNTEVRVTRVISSKEPVVMCNLIVDGGHAYFLETGLAHSFVNFRAVRVLMNKVVRLFRGDAADRYKQQSSRPILQLNRART